MSRLKVGQLCVAFALTTSAVLLIGGQASAQDAAAAMPHDLNPWTMFMSADIIVKAVMIGLVIASLVNVTVLVVKSWEIPAAKKRVRGGIQRIANARSLHEAQLALGKKDDLLSAMVTTASRELKLSADNLVESSVKERVASQMAEIVRAEGRSIRVGMGLLATIGSTAPFVGLFGTVWGIMNSFIGISKAQTTNLAVVAPGIAEALLATGIGLVAAIPAVIIYNHFTRQTRGYLDLVGQASGAVSRLLSRDLDHAGRAMSRAAE